MAINFNQAAKKITDTLKNFFKKENSIKKDTAQIVEEMIKESDTEKINDLKNKINQL